MYIKDYSLISYNMRQNNEKRKEICSAEKEVGWMAQRVKDNKIINTKCQRKSKWLILPNKKQPKTPSMRKYIDMLRKLKHAQHTISLGRYEDNDKYQNIDGNNRMKAITMFLDKPFEIYPDEFEHINKVLMEQLNKSAIDKNQYKIIKDFFFNLDYKTIFEYDDWFPFYSDHKNKIKCDNFAFFNEKIHLVLRKIRNTFQVGKNKAFSDHVKLLFVIYEGFTDEELWDNYYNLNRYNRSMTDIEMITAVHCSNHIDISNLPVQHEIYNEIKTYYEDMGKDELLEFHNIEDRANWRPNSFEILLGLHIIYYKKYNIIKKYKISSNCLPMLFRIYKIIYGDLYNLDNFSNEKITEFINNIDKCMISIDKINNMISPSIILESTYFKKIKNKNVLDKLSKTAKEIVLTTIYGVHTQNIDINEDIRRVILYEIFVSCVKNKEKQKEFNANNIFKLDGGGTVLDNFLKRILDSPSDIAKKLTKERFKKLIDYLFTQDLEPKTNREKDVNKRRKTRKLYEIYLFMYYYNNKAPLNFIQQKFSDEHLIPFTSKWNNETKLDICRLGNIIPLLHTINNKRGTKHIDEYERLDTQYDYIRHIKPLIHTSLEYNEIVEYIKIKGKKQCPHIFNNDAYNKRCESNEKLYRDCFLDTIF